VRILKLAISISRWKNKQIVEIGQPSKIEEGEVIGMQGTIQDVTNERIEEN
jgi:hypothetical protein